MNTAHLVSRHLKEFSEGNSMTGSHLRLHLDDITMQEATTQVGNLNSIATLVYHINYYVEAQLNVLQGNPLDAKDAYSFKLPPINSTNDWKSLQDKLYNNLKLLTTLVSKLSESQLNSIFVLEKYGTYHRNILGLLEHSHYHFGQIVILKKIIRSNV